MIHEGTARIDGETCRFIAVESPGHHWPQGPVEGFLSKVHRLTKKHIAANWVDHWGWNMRKCNFLGDYN